jgi:hypothetical protein
VIHGRLSDEAAPAKPRAVALTSARKKIVILGMMSHMPVAGNIWLVLQYLIGFRRLGFDVYYVEAHGINPGMLMRGVKDDSVQRACAFIDGTLRRVDLGSNWAFHALHADGQSYGLSKLKLQEVYRSAALIINLHGGTVPLEEHSSTKRLIYLETDPVELEIELYHRLPKTREFLAPHIAFFTWGLNYHRPDCLVPMPSDFRFKPTRPPVVLDFWNRYRDRSGPHFTTIGNWKQLRPEVRYKGEVYHWSKHLEFKRFIELPRRTKQTFELALSRQSLDERDRQFLETHGWRWRDALEFSTDIDAYREYIARSRGEFTVAKDQNVRLKSGWFSERSAQYLAVAKPVVTQETGFSNVLPTGAGLFGFSSLDEILVAIDLVNSDYARHGRAAADLAREYFSHDVVLPEILRAVGM